MTDAAPSPTGAPSPTQALPDPPRPAAEWAAAVLASLPRLTDQQWQRANATLGITTAPAVDQPTHPPRPRSARNRRSAA